MLIANPIYDVVFKYLLEDKEVAILLISEILGENVIDLEFKPQEREAFIESLTHDSVVIQIPQLRKEMRTGLERLLSVFDQSYVVTKDHHILDIDDAQFPEKYRKVLRRLVQAHSEPEVRQNMEVEDEYLEELLEQERRVQEAEEKTFLAEQKAEQAEQKAEHLMELLKKHGIDPQ